MLGSGYWALNYTIEDYDGYFKSLNDKYGLDKSVIEFTEKHLHSDPCPILGLNPHHCPHWEAHYYNVPKLRDNADIPNPKSIVDASSNTIEALKTSLELASFDMLGTIWDGNYEDVAQVLSLPVFAIIQAIDSMAEVKRIGQKIEDEEKANLIINIVSAVLFFVPFAGEGAAVAFGSANLARAVATAVWAGEGALAIYDIVNNPESAPMALIGLFAGGSIRGSTQFTKWANFRRSKSGDLSGMGKTFKAYEDRFQGLMAKSCKK